MSSAVKDKKKLASPRPTPNVWLSLLLLSATLIAYLPSIRGGLLWDDEAHITRPGLQSLDGLRRIWFDFGTTQQYYPLLHSAFWVEHHLWGDSTVGYHLLNVVLHAAAACLFALILSQLSISGAWVGAFIFALHPVCVESVAWISEQKNTLSAVFYLSAMLLYLRHDEETSGRSAQFTRRYFMALALFVAAILSKSVTATLPAALLVVIWWRRGKLSWQGRSAAGATVRPSRHRDGRIPSQGLLCERPPAGGRRTLRRGIAAQTQSKRLSTTIWVSSCNL